MTTLWSHIRRYIERRDLAKLIPSEQARHAEPEPPEPTPEGRLRVHLFGANFETAVVAFRTWTETAPSALNPQLTGALLDETQIEVIQVVLGQRLLESLSNMKSCLAGDNTLIRLTQHAFGGLPYTLGDTADMTYLGEIVVPV